MDPTPTIGLTAVPALSSDPSVVPCGVNPPPPLLDPSVPQPQAPLKVDEAGPLVSGSPTLSHQRVEGVVPADLGFPPAQCGIVPADIGFPPAEYGIVPADLGFPPAEIGIAPADLGFPPAVSGIVPVNTRFPPTACGVVPQGYCLPLMTSVGPRVGPTVQCAPGPITVPTPEVERGGVTIRPLCTAPGMQEPDESIYSDVQHMGGIDSTAHTEFSPPPLNDAVAQALEKSDWHALHVGDGMTAAAVLAPGKRPFTVGKPVKMVDISHFHFPQATWARIC